jgi:parallel beta-helix repeat protein
MRGEVLLLSSNVNVTASTDPESMTLAYPWPFGCQILVADFLEPADFSYRAGSINFDNVAVYNCSQEDTKFAGLKFHNAMTGTKKVTNSAISSGLGPGILSYSSRKIELRNNVIHDFIEFGIRAEDSSDIVIDGNIVNGVRAMNEEKPDYKTWVAPMGGIDVMDSRAYTVTNNIVASVWHYGFRLPAHACDGTNPHFGNVAHSNSGYGMIVAKSHSKKCSEFKGFKGYKNRFATMHMGGGVGSQLNIVRDLVAVDSAYGLMLLGSGSNRVEAYDSYIYGEAK